MQFRPELAQLILSGRKTQTRRVIKDGELWQFAPVRVFDTRRRLKWEVGKIYTVQPGRGKPAIGHIHLRGIHPERLWDISDADARAEGFADRTAFLEAFERINHVGYRNVEVWALTFELVPERDLTPLFEWPITAANAEGTLVQTRVLSISSRWLDSPSGDR